ncbi:MAG: LuxR C-terminal-related transcriptional regulator [Gemmatimonadaceae bacterium]
MALRLSDRDLSSLTAAMTVMLTPFCYTDGEQWRSAVCSALTSPMHSNGASFALTAPNEPFLAGPPDLVAALQALLPPPEWMLKGFERRRQLGLNVAGFSDIHDVEFVKRTPFYNDVVIPTRLFAPLVLAADFPGLPLPAVLGFTYDDEVIAARELPRNKQMLELLVPAFLGGVGTHIRLSRQRAALASVLDSMSVGVTIVDVDGKVIDENQAMKALMATESERNRVRAAVRQVALGVANIVARRKSPDWAKQGEAAEVRTASAQYRIKATFAWGGVLHRRDAVLALTERMLSHALTSEQLESRFRLTGREIETAQLMARGYSNREVATAMGISLNTARRHSEHVLLKLDVHSRAAVADRLGAAP